MFYFFSYNDPDVNILSSNQSFEELYFSFSNDIANGKDFSAEELFAFSCLVNSDWGDDGIAEHRLKYLCMSARKKYAKAFYEIYELLDIGEIGFPHDIKLAHRFLKAAYRYKFPQAYWQMGMVKIYEEKKIDEGVKLIKYAADLGTEQGVGQLLTFCDLKVWGFKKDFYWLYLLYRKYLLIFKYNGFRGLWLEIQWFFKKLFKA